MLLSLLETILVTYLMEKDSQEKLKLGDDWEDKQEKVKINNSNTGETEFSQYRINDLSDYLNYYLKLIDVSWLHRPSNLNILNISCIIFHTFPINLSLNLDFSLTSQQIFNVIECFLMLVNILCNCEACSLLSLTPAL